MEYEDPTQTVDKKSDMISMVEVKVADSRDGEAQATAVEFRLYKRRWIGIAALVRALALAPPQVTT